MDDVANFAPSDHGLVFMGTPAFAVPILLGLHDAGYPLLAVVTQPDRPAGRGRDLIAPPVKLAAERVGVPVMQPEKVRDEQFLLHMRELRPQLIVVAAFGQILPRSLLDIPARGCLNVHASLLPSFRGASPIQGALLAGCAETGVSIMLMDEQLDHGPIIARKSLTIERNDDAGSLTEKLAVLGQRALLESLPAWIEGKLTPMPQDDSQASFTRTLRKTDGLLDWERSAQQLERTVRAMSPWPGAYTRWNGKMLKVLGASGVETGTAIERPSHASPGAVAVAPVPTEKRKMILVRCADGWLRLERVQMEGKRPVEAEEFMRGAQNLNGSRFSCD